MHGASAYSLQQENDNKQKIPMKSSECQTNYYFHTAASPITEQLKSISKIENDSGKKWIARQLMEI